MSQFRIFLFGKFCVESNAGKVELLEGAKVQELFSYLLLHRDRPHLREMLATLLWSNLPAVQSRRNLRKTLWQLQSALQRYEQQSGVFLLVDAGWIELKHGPNLWFDVVEFEQAYHYAQDKPGSSLSDAQAAKLAAAVQLYRGDLLEGWYQDWCLFERERLQCIYLIMLEKLMLHCEARGRYEAGIDYGTEVLRYDRARERTHRRLIRLYHCSGNRTEALRQFQRCAEALRQELGVEPSEQTLALRRQISADEQPCLMPAESGDTASPEVWERLRALQATLVSSQQQLQREIELVESALSYLELRTAKP